jgi:hypothetical protein
MGEDTPRWLPPTAPGGQPPPRFEMQPDDDEPTPPPPRPEPAPPQQPQAPMVTAHTRPRTGTNGLAVTALVLGITGVGLLLLSAGLGFVLALPCSIGAWICGSHARNRIAAGEAKGGYGQAHAAYILGILGVVLGVIAMVGWLIAIAAGVSPTELQEDLQRELDRRSS